MTTRPNLFEFATSELSQDAFLCWLLSWADHSRAKVDSALHQAGTKFLTGIFEKFPGRAFATTPKPEIKIEKIWRQYKTIDVLAEILVDSKSYALVIEDKTHTTMHGEQLQNHRKSAKDKFPDHEILCVYLKTGEVSQALQAEEAGYAVYSRKDFLEALGEEPDDTTDSILRDFHTHLINMNNRYEAYKNKVVGCWINDWNAWEGFFGALQRKTKDKWNKPEWGYAANQSGGELVFAWERKCRKIENGWVYPQVIKKWENENRGNGRRFLAFKVSDVPKHERSEVRNDLHKSLMEAARQGNWSGRVKRPERFGHGETMVFCETVCDDAWLVKNDDGKLDMDKTIERLSEASVLLDRAIEIYKN
ncbi:MAG: PD-(D/E)XK nuclease family protein [Gammaproteobacteria bacterium]|nr:PD-(D/E)XK nuclease family protein [Gammaproteobacteria bacterium]